MPAELETDVSNALWSSGSNIACPAGTMVCAAVVMSAVKPSQELGVEVAMRLPDDVLCKITT